MEKKDRKNILKENIGEIKGRKDNGEENEGITWGCIISLIENVQVVKKKLKLQNI
jgi:hypothetical protein